MTPTGNHLQCTLHPQREAAARCASCHSFFCRECITEHDLRMLCAPCLKEATGKTTADKPKRSLLAPMIVLMQLAIGVALLWVSYYLLGRLLLAIPSEFHEGSIWGGL